MRRTTSAIAAIAVITAKLGVSVEAQTIIDRTLLVEERCEFYRSLDDRDQLLLELEQLLDVEPDNECIPVLVDLLGGTSVAEVLENERDSDLGDVFAASLDRDREDDPDDPY